MKVCIFIQNAVFPKIIKVIISLACDHVYSLWHAKFLEYPVHAILYVIRTRKKKFSKETPFTASTVADILWSLKII